MSNEECKVLATTIASAICADEWGESMSMRSDEALVKKYLAALYHFGKPSKDYFASSGRMKKNVFRSAILKHFNEYESLKVDLKNKFEKISKESSYLSGGSINAVKSSLEDTSVESIGHTHSLHINMMYYGFFVAMGLEDPRSDDGFPNIKMMIQPDVNHRPIEVERFLYNYEKKQKSYKGIVSSLFQDKLCNISSVNTKFIGYTMLQKKEFEEKYDFGLPVVCPFEDPTFLKGDLLGEPFARNMEKSELMLALKHALVSCFCF